ncbi:mRNA export factor rsm1 [Pleurostoma richardsiae]|uniref:mRNA export factor rsm1 n=1 Tax=Pleurostoma richardsiae TaxID=41990 RepID=A0AA38VDU8_9PEZI|nr:mRNA export factor rsm1 [Pleurostoma richardsiae]
MNATKRKFNALLQGIGTKPSPSVSAPDSDIALSTQHSHTSREGDRPAESLDTDRSNMRSSPGQIARSTVTSDLDFLSKRRRLGVPGSSPVRSGTESLQPTTGQTTISNIVLRKWSGNSKDSKPIAAPRYCPGDRDQLIRRLATFQELTDWTPKPDRVSEVEWAKRGWVCQGKERVRCTLCSKELVVKLNRKEVDGKEVPVLVPSEIEDALVDKYVELIVASHQDDCLWRKRGCDDSLLRLSLANPRAALEGLRLRYDELCVRKDFLPYEFNLRLPAGFSIDTVLGYLPPTFFSEPAPPPTNPPASSPNRAALALAVMGWQGLSNARIGPVPNSASCHTCLRRLGLWMFKSKEVDLETSTVLVPAPMDHLDPVREHRFFCPWKNGAAQRNPGAGTPKRRPAGGIEEDKPGWEVLVQVLKNDAYLRNRTGAAASSHLRTKSGDAGLVSAPGTPVRQRGVEQSNERAGVDGDEPEVEDEAAREAKDKERWARLRKVKSLFDTKGSKKLRKTLSRPGTGHSTAGGGEIG